MLILLFYTVTFLILFTPKNCLILRLGLLKKEHEIRRPENPDNTNADNKAKSQTLAQHLRSTKKSLMLYNYFIKLSYILFGN
jgi:hypothetical protein